MSGKDYKLEIEGRFIREYGLKGYALLVYCFLRDKTIKEGGFFDSISVMCDMFDTTNPNTIYKAIDNLIASGFCTLEKFVDGEGNLIKLYKIVRL